MDRLTEIPEIFCETCCNFSKENMDMGGNAQCKAIGVQTYSENYAAKALWERKNDKRRSDKQA